MHVRTVAHLKDRSNWVWTASEKGAHPKSAFDTPDLDIFEYSDDKQIEFRIPPSYYHTGCG